MAGSDVVHGWARDVQRFADDWPADGARVVDDAITARLRADTGDGGFSRGRRMGKATTRVDTGRRQADVVADGSRAVWTILEDGTGTHVVAAKPGSFLRTPYGPRRRVTVSGVPARRTFTVGAETGLAQAARAADAAWSRVGG